VTRRTSTATYDAANGVLTLSGTDTPEAYQAALHSVTYYNSGEDPSADTRTISYQSMTVLQPTMPATSRRRRWRAASQRRPVVAEADVIAAVTEALTQLEPHRQWHHAFADVDLTDTHSVSAVTPSAGALGS